MIEMLYFALAKYEKLNTKCQARKKCLWYGNVLVPFVILLVGNALLFIVGIVSSLTCEIHINLYVYKS